VFGTAIAIYVLYLVVHLIDKLSLSGSGGKLRSDIKLELISSRFACIGIYSLMAYLPEYIRFKLIIGTLMKKYHSKIKLSRLKKAHLKNKERFRRYSLYAEVYWHYPVGDTKINAWYIDREGFVKTSTTPDVAP